MKTSKQGSIRVTVSGHLGYIFRGELLGHMIVRHLLF